MYSTATYVNVTKKKQNTAISAFGRLISLFKYSAEEEPRICDGGGWGEEEEEEEEEGGGVQSGSGCDMEYSDGGGNIQLTPFHFLFFFLPLLASSLRHMGKRVGSDGSDEERTLGKNRRNKKRKEKKKGGKEEGV